MALEPLAAVSDLSVYNVDTSDIALVERLLESVSAAVRDAAGVPITKTTSTVTMWTESSKRVELPAMPVHSVDEVRLNGELVTGWVLRGVSLYRDIPWQKPWEVPAELQVTFTHGYDPVPADIVKLVCTLVAAGVHENDEGMGETRGVSSERLDDYQVSFTRGEAEVVDKTELPAATRAWLRSRFGGKSAVAVGSTP